MTPTQILALVNSMTDGTTVQRDLVKFQKKYYPAEKPGTVVSGYWKGFRKRNRHLVVLKRGQKYEFHRSVWSTYADFAHMYDQVIEELQNANLVELLEAPKFMDKDGKELNEYDAFSCKVTHDILRQEMCLVVDKEGGKRIKREMKMWSVSCNYAKEG